MHIMTKDEYDQWMANHIAYAKQYMTEHDMLPIDTRMAEYGGRDHTWNQQHRQAQPHRYTLSSVQLRRMGVGR